MSAGDVFMLLVRWLHVVSAVAWVGGSIFYLLVLRPAARRNPRAAELLGDAAATEFRALVDTCIIVLIVTGGVLTFHRLESASVGAAYVLTLAAKVGLAAVMFALAWRRRRAVTSGAPELGTDRPQGRLARVSRALSGYNLIAILGVLVFLLADLLAALYEMAISG